MNEHDYAIPAVSMSTIRRLYLETDIEFHDEFMRGVMTQPKWCIYLGKFLTIEQIAKSMNDEEFVEMVRATLSNMEVPNA